MRHGDRRLPRRFWAKVRIDRRRRRYARTPCWLWAAATVADGYGQFGISSGRMVGAHRHAYRALVGSIPHGLQLDHLCRVRHCVNPRHLEPVTPRQNSRRGVGFAARNARKKRCPRGHLYTANNIRMYKGSRHCRKCGCDHGKAYRSRNQTVVRLKARARYYMRAGKTVPVDLQRALQDVPWKHAAAAKPRRRAVVRVRCE